MSNVTPDFYRSTMKRDNIWRTQGLLGHEYDQSVMIAPANPAGTGFGPVQPGTPLGKIVGGTYDGLFRPAGPVVVDGEQMDETTILTKASDLLFAGDRVLIFTPSRAFVDSDVGPFRVAHGQTLVFDVDGDGDQTQALDATKASITASDVPGGAQAGDLVLEFNGIEFTVTFTTEDSVEAFATTINQNVTGGRAYADTGKLKLESDISGTDSQVKVVADGSDALVLANLNLTGDEEDTVAVADCADASRMTADELAAWINADFTGVSAVVLDSGAVRVMTESLGNNGSLAFDPGTADFGFDTEAVNGAGMYEEGAPYYEQWMDAVPATVVSVDKDAKTVTFEDPVTVIDGAVIRLDYTQAGYGVENGLALGVNNKAVNTYDEKRTNDLGVVTHTRRQSTMGCAGTGYSAHIVGWCAALQDDLQNRSMRGSSGCMIQFRSGEQY